MKVIGERREHGELKHGGNDYQFPEIKPGAKRDNKKALSEGRGGQRKPRRKPCCRSTHFDPKLNHARRVRNVATDICQMLETVKIRLARVGNPRNCKRADNAHS